MTEAPHDRSAKQHRSSRRGTSRRQGSARRRTRAALLSHKAATPILGSRATTFCSGHEAQAWCATSSRSAAFIELTPGVDGLLHTSDLTFKRIEHPPKRDLKQDEKSDV